VVRSELTGLGGLVLELALLDGTAVPQASILTWANRLAAELDVPGVGRPADYRELFHAIVKISRHADADPDRPTVAIPPAQAA
jgi:hypothetical protein